jgi:hypothetical protein
VSKDRAAPFSKKHRRYWLPVTGGMVLIGALNVMLGLCTYEPAGDPEPIRLGLIEDAGVPGQLGVAQIPADVMRGFAIKYPKTIPLGARVEGGAYVVLFPRGAAKQRATFRLDGSFVSDE